MYRRRLKQKAALLVVLTGILILLIAPDFGKERHPNPPKEAEGLDIPEGEQPTDPEEAWTLPSADAVIRVLLLGEGGSIYHEAPELKKEYPGELEYYEEEQGWVIVNEAPLEEYLRRVTPSEMPSDYAMEALKAQAVCARTYAVWQMREYAYPEYKAHVDDSVSYQVYNKIESQETTDQAVEQTKGQILLYEDEPVKAYYFSTSCGSTTDEAIWEKGDREQTPYIAGRLVCVPEQTADLTDEEAFAEYIRKKHGDDLEISEPWYRWNCYISLEQIEENVKRWAKERAKRSQDGIMEEEDGAYRWSDADSVGKIVEARIISRNAGGAAQEMLVTGEGGELKVKYEYNIRLLLGIPGGEVHKNDGSIASGANLLPSGYFVLEEVEEDGALCGYRAYGGGLGHGAGMSQNGARALAEQGYSYDGILTYFYQGVRLARLE